MELDLIKSKLYCKILAVGIIVLFIGVSVSSAVYNEDKASTSDNENPANTDEEIFQNANCFIIGKTYGRTQSSFGPFVKGGGICFGESEQGTGTFPTIGWIYTHGKSVKWKYEGGFYGKLGEFEFVRFHHRVVAYIGVTNFTGIKWGCHDFFYDCIFIGHAEHVKITNKKPPYQ